MKTLIYLFLLISVCGYGQVITYNFTGRPGNQTSTPPTTVASGWTASDITRGSGLRPDAGMNSMGSDSFDLNFNPNDYFQFTITTPSTGGSFDVSGLSFSMRRSGTGPQTVDLAYSINSGSESIVSTVTGITDNSSGSTSVSFPTVTGLGTSSTLRIRIYGYGATGTLGTLRLLGSGSLILPVTYLYFNTKVVKDKVTLEFATASEENNDFFQIERSRDGINFDAFDRLPSKASRGGESIYKLMDNTPYTGINYYRIKQVDTDGKFSYSKVSAVDFNSKTSFIVLSNRTYNDIEINSGKESYDVQLFNTSGQLLKNLSGLSSNQTISLSDVNAGTYILRMISGNEVVTEKVVKM